MARCSRLLSTEGSTNVARFLHRFVRGGVYCGGSATPSPGRDRRDEDHRPLASFCGHFKSFLLKTPRLGRILSRMPTNNVGDRKSCCWRRANMGVKGDRRTRRTTSNAWSWGSLNRLPVVPRTWMEDREQLPAIPIFAPSGGVAAALASTTPCWSRWPPCCEVDLQARPANNRRCRSASVAQSPVSLLPESRLGRNERSFQSSPTTRSLLLKSGTGWTDARVLGDRPALSTG